MGITPITDASGLMDQLTLTGVNSVQPVPGGSDFKSIWNDQAANAGKADNLTTYVAKDNSGTDLRKDVNSGNDNITDKSSEQTPVKTDKASKDDEASKTDVKGKESPDEAGDTKAADNAEAGGVLKDEDIVSAQEVLAVQIAELVQKITEILGIDPEELEGILQQNGIDKMQLLDGEVLSQVLVQALGADSRLSLLTDETNYDLFNRSMEALNEILGKESGIEDLNIGELKELVSETLSKEGNEIPEGVIVETDDKISAETPKASDRPETVRYERDSNGNFIRTDVSENGKEVGSETLVMKAEKPENQNRNFEAKKDGNTEDHMMSNMSSFEEIKTEGEAPVQETPFTYSTSAQEIADQILDHMKTVTDGDYSDVEMQLHPASLGTLHIHVTNNAGVLTASFVTENEAVRSAVESQMTRLIEQFESQGIKIEAVEVTVASHAFEQGSDTGRSNESGDGNPKRTRRINLGDYADDDDMEDMEEDEKIAAQMMAANGNTVDFMA